MKTIQDAVLRFWNGTESKDYNGTDYLPPKEYYLFNGGDSVISAESMERCVYRAVRDLTVRTMEKAAEYKEQPITYYETTQAIVEFWHPEYSSLNGNLYKWFSNTNTTISSFDTWHHDACLLIENVLKRFYADASYGKAQKIVNMTFKQIYCLWIKHSVNTSKNSNFENYFLYCHMPLDSFTLEWFKRVKKDKQCLKSRNHKHGKNLSKFQNGGVPNWSIMLMDDEHSVSVKRNQRTWEYTYKFFVDEIGYLFGQSRIDSIEPDNIYGVVNEKYAKFTPLQAEFLIWSDIQLKMSIEGYINQAESLINPLPIKDKKNRINCVKEAALSVNIEDALLATLQYAKSNNIDVSEKAKDALRELL